MVRAVLSGQKTQTRRPIKDGPEWRDGGRWTWTASSTDRKAEGCFNYSYPDPNGNTYADRGPERTVFSKRCPLGLAGDRLWVRETFAIVHPCRDMETGYIDDIRQPTDIPKDNGGGFWVPWYRADWNGNDDADRGFKWIPSIHMPCWASRITLPLVSVRVERVQDINEKDAWAEGLRRTDFGWSDGNTGYDTVTARDAFRELWDSIYGTWDANPWVWVAEWENAEVVR
jgi:hypothetical protein